MERKIQTLSSSAYVVYTTAKQVTSFREKNKNSSETYKNEKRCCKAYSQNYWVSLINMKICYVIVAFLVVISYAPYRRL